MIFSHIIQRSVIWLKDLVKNNSSASIDPLAPGRLAVAQYEQADLKIHIMTTPYSYQVGPIQNAAIFDQRGQATGLAFWKI